MGLTLVMMLKQMPAQTLREGLIRREEITSMGLTFLMMLNLIAALTQRQVMNSSLMLLLRIPQTLLRHTLSNTDSTI